MKPYIHCADGRIRVKTKSLKSSRKANLLCAHLLEIEGVEQASPNTANGSITIKYDTTMTTESPILSSLSAKLGEQVCSDHDKQPDFLRPQQPIYAASAKADSSQVTNQISKGIAARAGHIAIGVLLEKSIRYSMSNLFGIR